MAKCWRCKKELICSGNFMLSDYDCEDISEDDDAMITDYSCPYCGAQYTVTDTPVNEQQNYPYWNKSLRKKNK